MNTIVFPPSPCGRKVMTGALVISSPTALRYFSIAADNPSEASPSSEANVSAPPLRPTEIFLTRKGAA